MPVTSPRMAAAIVEELIAGGVDDVVLAPGSRSAPLALALADAERGGLLRLHVRIDERSAAYLALGLARISGQPTAVVTTSGTAAVNLHAAVVEAAYSGVPLVVVTADRPGAMRGTGANQTIDQRQLFGPDPVASLDLEDLDEIGLRAAVTEALTAADGAHRGPIHLNVPLAEPLVVAGEHAVNQLTRRRLDASTPARMPLASLLPAGIADVSPSRGVLVVGDFDDPATRVAAADLAAGMGWPVISEPSGNLSSHPHALRHGPLVCSSARELDLVPDVVVSVGRVGLHRSVSELLRAARVHIAVDVPPRLGRVDPVRTASAVVDAVPIPDSAPDLGWWARWRELDVIAARVIDGALSEDLLTGPVVARIVAEAAGEDDLVVVGPSWPVRHLSMYAGPLRARCIGNRGTSGIDGVVSTAWGAAVAHALRHAPATTYALIGDLTAIYDRNGLLAPEQEPRPRLDYIVIDNDGGGIFSALEQGAPEFAPDFDRVFGTPHGADLALLLTAPRVEVTTVESSSELRQVLAQRPSGVRVIIARCAPRQAELALVRTIDSAVEDALT